MPTRFPAGWREALDQGPRASVIAAAAADCLAAVEPRPAGDLAAMCGCTVGELVRVLDADGRFVRVAGDGCWWWQRDPFLEISMRRAAEAERKREAVERWAGRD